MLSQTGNGCRKHVARREFDSIWVPNRSKSRRNRSENSEIIAYPLVNGFGCCHPYILWRAAQPPLPSAATPRLWFEQAFTTPQQLTGLREPGNCQLTRGYKTTNCNCQLLFLQLTAVAKVYQLMVVGSLEYWACGGSRVSSRLTELRTAVRASASTPRDCSACILGPRTSSTSSANFARLIQHARIT